MYAYPINCNVQHVIFVFLFFDSVGVSILFWNDQVHSIIHVCSKTVHIF